MPRATSCQNVTGQLRCATYGGGECPRRMCVESWSSSCGVRQSTSRRQGSRLRCVRGEMLLKLPAGIRGRTSSAAVNCAPQKYRGEAWEVGNRGHLERHDEPCGTAC